MNTEQTIKNIFMYVVNSAFFCSFCFVFCHNDTNTGFEKWVMNNRASIFWIVAKHFQRAHNRNTGDHMWSIYLKNQKLFCNILSSIYPQHFKQIGL